MATAKEQRKLWLERIAESLEGLRYGNVQITIHDGKIVQIDRTERKRFDHSEESQARPE